jgi:hypothetical protein
MEIKKGKLYRVKKEADKMIPTRLLRVTRVTKDRVYYTYVEEGLGGLDRLKSTFIAEVVPCTKLEEYLYGV